MNYDHIISYYLCNSQEKCIVFLCVENMLLLLTLINTGLYISIAVSFDALTGLTGFLVFSTGTGPLYSGIAPQWFLKSSPS